MSTIDILGSCVTRDAFAFIKNDFTLNSYHPRTSIISIYSPPIDIKKDGIEVASEYQQRLVHFDFTKKFFYHIKSTNAKYLIIDFMDERLGVLETTGSYITNSEEYKKTQLKNIFNTRTLEFDDEFISLWKRKALQFIDDVKKAGYTKVFLHRSVCLDSYISKDGERLQFTDPAVIKRSETRNNLLNIMYDFIEYNLDVVVIDPKGYSADANHKWGLTPFHYEKGYYTDFMKQLDFETKEAAAI